MRTWLRVRAVWCALAWALCGAGSALAATQPFTGRITLFVENIEGSALVKDGQVAQTTLRDGDHLAELSIPLSAAATNVSIPITDPGAAPIGGLRLDAANGTGLFQETNGGGFTGVMPLLGAAKVCLFGACNAAAANVSVPLTVVGQGGATTASDFINVTVTGTGWTTGTVPFGEAAGVGFLHGPASNTSSTGASGAALRLVSPIYISTNIPASAVIPAYAAFDIDFAPEPGQLLLLGGAAGALIAMGWSRRTR